MSKKWAAILENMVDSILKIFEKLQLEYKKRKNKLKAEKLSSNWTKFKIILERYKTTPEEYSLQEYQVLRKEIREDLNYFLSDITEILSNAGQNHLDIVLNNFQQCFEPTDLKEWFGSVKREVSRELDCFDYILASLVRHFDK